MHRRAAPRIFLWSSLHCALEKLWYMVRHPFEEERRGLSGESLNGQLSRLVSELVRRGLTLEQARNEFEKQFILASLRSQNGNFSKSAKFLGVHRNTLRNKISNLGMSESDFAEARPTKRRRSARRIGESRLSLKG